MSLDVARQLDRLGQALDAGEDHAIDAALVPFDRRQRKVGAIAYCPKANSLCAERFSEVLQVVGALLCVVSFEVNAVLAKPFGAGPRNLAEGVQKLSAIGRLVGGRKHQMLALKGACV